MSDIINKMNGTYLKHLNESKLLIGIAMILLNIGSKYVDASPSSRQ